MKEYRTAWMEGNKRCVMIVHVRYDDRCHNGHNTFSITAEIRENGRMVSCGCMHDEIAARFPELAPLIQWHLVSTDGPLHYIANTVYHLQQGNLEYARSSAVWPDMPESFLTEYKGVVISTLLARLPSLMAAFQATVESLGFTY